MKLYATLIFICFSANNIQAQENEKLIPYFDFSVSADYQFDLMDGELTSLSSLSKPAGFFGTFDFGIELKRIVLFGSAFVKSHPANDLEDYRQELDYASTINTFSSGNFISSGLLFGGMYALQHVSEKDLPVYSIYLQIGISRTVLPAMYIESIPDFSTDSNIYKYTFSRTSGAGAIVNCGLNVEIFESDPLAGNLKFGFLNEQSSFPITFLYEDDNTIEYRDDTFKWKSFSTYLGFSLSF